MKKISGPVKADMTVVNCRCDFCQKILGATVWIWNEHFACSRDHAERAQESTNALASAGTFKQSVRDIDLL